MSAIANRIKAPGKPRSWWWTRAAVDMSGLPVTVDIAAWPMVKMSLFFLFPVIMQPIGKILFAGSDDDLAAIAIDGLEHVSIMAAIIGTPILVVALWCRRRITFDTHGVTVEWVDVSGRQSWSLPYSAYERVLYRETSWLQMIELHHPDSEKSVPLYVQKAAARAQWKAYARWFDLPAGMVSGSKIVSRLPGELDKTIDERAREGSISAAPPPWPAPAGLTVAPDTLDGEFADCISITARRPGFGEIAIFLAIAMAMLLSIMITWNWVWSVFLGLTALSLFLLGLAHWQSTRPRSFRVSATHLAVEDRALPRKQRAFTVPLADLEDVRLVPGGNHPPVKLFIANRTEQSTFGEGLSIPALKWLRDYILSVAARGSST